MSKPSFALCSLVLNEMEWLPKLYEQHKHWPGMIRWIFVEAADLIYANVNPGMVSPEGLSIDGTTEFLRNLAKTDDRVTHIAHGLVSHEETNQGKCTARQKYLDVADLFRPDFLFVLDADEFYDLAAQDSITRILGKAGPSWQGFIFRQRHIWRPPSVSQRPLFHAEVVGGYWSIPHARGFRWRPNMRYVRNHNIPEGSEALFRYDNHPSNPECVHLGFASDLTMRRAKHAYYVVRGEGRSRHYQMHVECRHAFETWEPGNSLPYGAQVVPYYGSVPEVFK